ncbi:ABC transporter permease [Pseudonocardia benzenivorans]|jgi:ribose transport system permease protein|uniref:ABC transporter permease n=1 Tax=Pseudonocardia benzenivorans TaxID=228005 RepID=A0ABW3VTA4_9PSEU|nr:sugar ABC transporter permease [Pseudonocardia sp. D17]
MTTTESAPGESGTLPPGRPPGRRGAVSTLVARSAERIALPVVWVAIIVLFGVLRPDTFLTAGNFSAMFSSQTSLLVLALALTIPLTAGDYDLSVGSVASLSAMLIGILNVQLGVPVVWAVLVALAVATLIGVANAVLSIAVGVDTLIVTLGMGTFVQGIVSWTGNDSTVTGISAELVRVVVQARFLGIPVEFWYGIVLCAVLFYVMEFTPLGRRLLIVGRGREVARLSGVRVRLVRGGALVSSAFLAGLAGVLIAGTSGAADQTSAPLLLLPAFAAAFLGATTIMPGRFNSWGVLVAVLFLVTGITGLQQLGARPFVQNLFYGAALIVAVVLSFAVRSRRRKAA